MEAYLRLTLRIQKISSLSARTSATGELKSRPRRDELLLRGVLRMRAMRNEVDDFLSPLDPATSPEHRGSRFSYTYYRPSPQAPSSSLSSNFRPREGEAPIHQSIRDLDNEGMQAITFPSSSSSSAPQQGGEKTAAQAKDEFAAYLKKTRNTVCGRHPIGVLLGALAELESQRGQESECRFVRYEVSKDGRQKKQSRCWCGASVEEWTRVGCKWQVMLVLTRWKLLLTSPLQQSSECETYRDSSVSYASAFVRFL